MQFGALIVAAGMSSRMGEFKPMLNIGSISIAQRIVATLRQSGVTRIVMVTGHNARELEHHLANNGPGQKRPSPLQAPLPECYKCCFSPPYKTENSL